jgi:hypothetical protein
MLDPAIVDPIAKLFTLADIEGPFAAYHAQM